MLSITIIARHGDRLTTLARDVRRQLYGVEGASAVLRTLRIFSHPSNRTALEQELSFLSSLKPGDPMANALRDSLETERSGAFNYYIDTSPSVYDIISFSRQRLGSKVGDCITAIIDITNLDRLKYCFATSDHKTEDALTYVGRFLDVEAPIRKALEGQHVAHAIAKFEFIESISVLPALPIGSSEEDVPRRPVVKSLVDLCIAKLPDLFQSTKNVGVTDHEVLDLSHIKTSIWEYSVENASTLATAPDHVSAGVLALALKGQSYINLAPFRDLAPTAARAVLQSLPGARAINLSGTAAIADDEIEGTLAAIGHDLDALYLLTPPSRVGELPKAIMLALKKWNHKCSKVLISSVLEEGTRWGIHKWFNLDLAIYPSVCRSTQYASSRSFPITQIMYKSTFKKGFVSSSRPILAHAFIGGGLVAPFRLWTGILKTIKDMDLNLGLEELQFVKFLIHNLALGPPTPDSEEYLEVRSIPTTASFVVYKPAPTESVYSNPGYHMWGLTPDAWTVVVLRDEIPKDILTQDGIFR
ncbi:hypothetical protein M441DRAFT_91330 [Trichoderma asperellum CBS 433.97]|uniref:Uncharacterized protein n=1 Tax=Trichoderma asperellum (strain ATCC 204424 / CBS 433.97 / NBRC 101777) TaxID=1042311 RepID=A0A2T3Z1U9_TRIA4|nr:hypothetical protein M441DRAFT_91330 [Trichoderma asperellum CBS 433.97]PTB38720.1 hypothetical protein M441DRAFT_91330 [Trichoderma asperellum CBS 433.97]